jgi:hypothetical protein
MSAGGKFLSARGKRKSAGGKSFCQRIEGVVERQKENGCYSICAAGAFPITWVTSEPTSLHDELSIHDNPTHGPFARLMGLD